jgi:formylglycine-generating enzyme required for sulfatase activity
MLSEGAWEVRGCWLRAGAALVSAALLALPAHDSARAQDDRYPSLTAPAPPRPDTSEERNRRGKPAVHVPAVERAAPRPEPPVTTATLPPPGAAANAPPRDPALDGIALDPSWPKQVLVIGDSVMLGAKPALAQGLPDWQMTFLGRPALMVPKAVEELPRGVGSVVIVALGYNSLWQQNRQNFQIWADRFDKEAEKMLAALKQRGARKIVWVMLRELYPDNVPGNGTATMQSSKYGWYFPYVNERLRALKQRHPEIALADWATAGRQGGVTYDAIHLNPRGAELMVDVVRAAIGLGPRPPKVPGTVYAQARPAEEARPSPEPEKKPQPVEPLGLRTSEPDAVVPVGPMSKPSYAFRDCAKCPEMVVIPAGSFTMGAPDDEADRNANEGPQRLVTIPRPFAVGKFEVTFAEWEACVAGGGCKGNPAPADEGWGKDRQPVINVSWDDAQEYAAWLSRATGKTYRLLTEAEWEYAARAGTTSPFATGAAITPDQANFQTNFKDDGNSREGEYREQTIKVGSFAPNAFDLHDMHGNVWEWVQDNWHEDYTGAPTNGAVGPGGDATMRAKRGGGWYSLVVEIRSASRQGDQPDHRGADIGFRVARGL